MTRDSLKFMSPTHLINILGGLYNGVPAPPIVWLVVLLRLGEIESFAAGGDPTITCLL